MLMVEVITNGRLVRRQPLARRLTIGRAAANDIILAHDSVSRVHAVMWVKGQQAWLEDLDSRNGTRLNRARTNGPVPVGHGDDAAVGTTLLRLRGEPRAQRSLQVLDASTGIVHPLGPGLHRVADRTVIVRDGGVWVNGTDLTAEADPLGRFSLVQGKGPPTGAAPPVHVRATAHGATGIEVTLRCGPHQLHVTHNRAILLYRLAVQRLRDQQSLVPRKDRGWCSDDSLRVAIWGRGGPTMDANGLHVLLHRLRTQLRRANIDVGCLEKCRGRTRLNVNRCLVEEEP